MTIQALIDAIDPNKPVNATPSQKPTLKSVRDNTAAIKNALQAIVDSPPVTTSPHYEVLTLSGFNEDVLYLTGENKVPNFLTLSNGDILYAKVSS